jgi:hypothetical protein
MTQKKKPLKGSKLSRDTVSLEKEGKRYKREVLNNTRRKEWETEVKEYRVQEGR